MLVTAEKTPHLPMRVFFIVDNSFAVFFIKPILNLMQYSFAKGLIKAAVSTALFAIPVLLNVMPQEWMDLTVGGVLVLLMNFLKIKFL